MKSHFQLHSTYLIKRGVQIIVGLFFCMKFNCHSGGNNYCGNTVNILKHSKFTYFTTFITFQYFDGIEIQCKMQRLD